MSSSSNGAAPAASLAVGVSAVDPAFEPVLDNLPLPRLMALAGLPVMSPNCAARYIHDVYKCNCGCKLVAGMQAWRAAPRLRSPMKSVTHRRRP